MAAKHQILCISKLDRQNPHERITHIGGRSNGQAWQITQEAAIKGIEDGQWNFFVSRNGQSVDVVVSVSRYGNKYLTTERDGESQNNLLSLSECT